MWERKDEDTSDENIPNMGDSVQQGESIVGVALSCIFYKDFLVKGTVLDKRKAICAEMTVNT